MVILSLILKTKGMQWALMSTYNICVIALLFIYILPLSRIEEAQKSKRFDFFLSEKIILLEK